jgi:hypothetical protein
MPVMKKFALIALFFSAAAFADQIVLDNQTSYPAKNQKIAIQWASSAQEVDANNKALMYGWKSSSDSIQVLKQKGKIVLTIPKKATYFRVVAWSNNETAPDYSTNWIDIVPDTTYTLETQHLTPVVLMSGMGC